MGVNSLHKTVTRQRRDCDLNPGPTVPECSTLTTRLPSHPLPVYNILIVMYQLIAEYFRWFTAGTEWTMRMLVSISGARISAVTLSWRAACTGWPHINNGLWQWIDSSDFDDSGLILMICNSFVVQQSWPVQWWSEYKCLFCVCTFIRTHVILWLEAVDFELLLIFIYWIFVY